MSYNLSKNSVIRSKNLLDQLERVRSNVHFPANNPKELQQRLNEALKAAEVHEEFRHYYDNVRPYYKFSLGENEVIARYVAPDATEGTVIQSQSEDGNAEAEEPIAPTQKLHRKSVVIDSAINLLEVLGSILQNLDATELEFPNAILTNEEKLKLWGWTKDSEHMDWLMIDRDDRGLVLTKDDVPPEMVWMPPDEEIIKLE